MAIKDREPINTSKEEVLIEGPLFTLPAAKVEGATRPSGDLVIIPQVVSVLDSEEKPLTLQIAYQLSQPIKDPLTGELTEEIRQGSFGQHDPVRMWLTGNSIGKMITGEDHLSAKSAQYDHLYKNDGLVRLPELLYSGLQASFFDNLTKWETLPSEILDEVGERIVNNHPLNYQYLAHMLEEKQAHEFQFMDPADIVTIITRAQEERMRGYLHRADMFAGGGFEYQEIMPLVNDIEFAMDYAGEGLIDNNMRKEFFNFHVNLDHLLVSDKPAVNFSYSIIRATVGTLQEELGFRSKLGNDSAFPLVADHVRQTLTQRLYFLLSQKGHIAPDISLGEFASEVYGLAINNGDTQVRQYLRTRTPSIY